MHIRFILLFLFSALVADETCPFCNPAIVEKQEVYRGNHWRVLLDYKPVLEGHLLLVPIEHRLTRHDLTREEHNELFDIEQKVHCAFTKRFGANIEDLQYEKNGPTLQSVHHFHIHVLPIDAKMKSAWQKMRLFSRLFFFPLSKMSEEEILQEKEQWQLLFQNC